MSRGWRAELTKSSEQDFIKYYHFGGIGEWEVVELGEKEESRTKE